MRRRFSAFSLLLLLPACSASEERSAPSDEPEERTAPIAQLVTDDSQAQVVFEGVPLGEEEETGCQPVGEDFDGDGFTVAEGDCNDCEPNANPGALDVPGNGVDEDCDGAPDNSSMSCDETITDLASDDAFEAAAAIGLCQKTSDEESGWGVISAQYTRADGQRDADAPNPLSHGLLEGFGDVLLPREGQRLLGLSSGTARAPGDPDYESPNGFYQEVDEHGTPLGFSADAPSCPGVMFEPKAYDSVSLELKLRAPTNAQSFSFDFNFHTFEFPEYICSEFNDFFVVLMDPPPEGLEGQNISFDSVGNPVSVNNGLLQVCQPQEAGGKTFDCPLGVGELAGTGFDVGSEGSFEQDHAATGWLNTTVPIEPGQEFTLRFVIWDAGDPVLDSTVLVDNFYFSVEEATAAATKPVVR